MARRAQMGGNGQDGWRGAGEGVTGFLVFIYSENGRLNKINGNPVSNLMDTGDLEEIAQIRY
jgi:hypothetical protein